MPTQPEVTVRPYPRFLLGRLLHGITTLIIVVANLSHCICHAFADNLGEKPCRPNIVLILADDLGWGDLGCYGNTKFKTPRLDRMAAEGVRLTNFYSVCPYCAPARYGLLTGRYPNRGGMTNNPAPDGGPNSDRLGIRDDERTLGEMFQSAGYRTACVGKWHLGHQPQFYPTRHGFDEYFGILYSNDMRPVRLMDGERVAEYPVVQATLTKRYTERCLDFIEKHRDEPFFLYVPQVMVHKPLAASAAFYKQTGTGLYGDALAELDWSVGQILDKLDALKLGERTFVFFSSDNGPWFGGSTGGLRGMKAQGFEGGIRVPLIARRPGTLPAGRTSDQPAAIIDLFPTVLKASGIALPAGVELDGRDLLPLLAEGAPSPHEHLFTLTSAGVITVRRGTWKLHVGTKYGRVQMPSDGSRWRDPRGPDETTMLAPFEQPQPSELAGIDTGDPINGPTLFDLSTDPSEQKNVASVHPDVVKDLLARVEAFRQSTPQPTAPERQTTIVVHKRSRPEVSPGKFEMRTVAETWQPQETAVIVCDMWDAHHCLNAVRRSVEMAPRMNNFLQEARSRGTLIIHAPSSCMEAYQGHPGRALAMSAPKAANLPEGIAGWCRQIPAEERGEYPIDQAGGGEDDDPEEHRVWHEKLAAMGLNPKAPWKKQMDGLTIAPGDAISDSGIEIWNLLEARGVKNIILLGVHTNMCVAGRPFGLRQMSKNGKNTVLVRDLTDTMYDPAKRPFVTHHTGTDLIVEHIEKFICPSITSVDLLGGAPFRFSDDKRPTQPE
jgi:arylsulfatase A-like enzyme/nicotinamidase-related amidase